MRLFRRKKKEEKENGLKRFARMMKSMEDNKAKCLSFLKDSIKDGMSMPEMVDVFEKMCEIPLKDEMILFQTGISNYNHEEKFYFSLVRQIPNDEEEFYQIELCVLYEPDDKNKEFHDSTWDADLEENIFDHIRKSAAYEYSKDIPYVRFEISMDET